MDGTNDRKNMLAGVKKGIEAQVKRRRGGGEEEEEEEDLGRDGEILSNAFPSETNLFAALKKVMSGKSPVKAEGIDLELEAQVEDEFKDDEILHFDSAKIETSKDKMAKVGSRRRFTQLAGIKVEGGEAGSAGVDVTHMKGWLEKQVRWGNATEK